MTNHYTTLPDGSLVYDEPIQLCSTYWRTDPDNPCHYIPIVPECTKRKIELRVLNCGRRRADWKCELQNGKHVTPKVCNECQQSVKPSTEYGRSEQTDSG